MKEGNPSYTPAAASPSALPFTRVPSRASPAPSAYITSVGLHPVEPLQVVGLSSGEVCLYAASTDALSWLVELDAARQDQIRLNQAMCALPTGDGSRVNVLQTESSNHVDGAAALAPPDYPLKVFSFASLSSSPSAEGGCAIMHCGFLRGREDDLIREVVQPRQSALAATASAASAVARHLLYVVTSANEVFVADVISEVVLVHWDAFTAAHITNCGGTVDTEKVEKEGETSKLSGSSFALCATSPLHAQFLVTQVETFGALMFLTVARRSNLPATSAVLLIGNGCGPERNALDFLNEPCVYVLHLGYTQPFAAAGTKGLVAGGGPYVIRCASQDKQKVHDPTRPLRARRSSGNISNLSIRVHPFASLLMLIINRAEVQVFAIGDDESYVASKKAQLILFNSPLSSTSTKGSAPVTFSAAPPPPLLDAQFVPSAAVLVRNSDSSASSSSSLSSKHCWSCRNVQILLLSSTRLRLVYTLPASSGEAAGAAEVSAMVAVDRVFYTAPETTGFMNGTTKGATSHSRVSFLRAWTWLASPDTFFVLQSDRTLLELSCNDLLAASMKVPSVRSRRLLPPRAIAAGSLTAQDRKDTAAIATNGNKNNNNCDSSSSAYVSDWWLLPPTASRLPCVQVPDVLPLWGRGSVLSGVFAQQLPAYHSDDPQSIVFSKLTGLSRPLPIMQDKEHDDATAAKQPEAEEPVNNPRSTPHVCLLADTEMVSSCCISIRLCLTPQCTTAATAAEPSAASLNASGVTAPRVTQESVNVNIARVLCESSAPALCRFEHSFYFVGSCEGSAYSDYPFLVAGLQYVDSIVPEIKVNFNSSMSSNTSSTVRAVEASRDVQLRVAMVCLPADRRELRRLYDSAKTECGSFCGNVLGEASTPTLSLSVDLEETLRQFVRHTQVQALPIPQFDFELPYTGEMTKQLQSCAFQLSNDGVVPCVWGLWAPVYPCNPTTSTSAETAMASPLPPPQSLQLTMQSYYIAAESLQLLWRPPELVKMNDLLASNPSQVFALNSVLTKGGSADDVAAAALPVPYLSIDDALADVDATVVARIFLYYADRKVLVLATVETSSSQEAGFNSEMIDDAYNFASRARSGRVVGGRLFAGEARAAETKRGDGRHFLRLVPHAAAEMNDWKGESTAEALSGALLSGVQLSAVLVNDHGEPAVQVAITSRRFGVALALFPLAGRRGTARVPAALQPVKVYLYRKWAELLCVTAVVRQQTGESEGRRLDASGDWGRRGVTTTVTRAAGVATTTTTISPSLSGVNVEDVQHSPLLHRLRAWADTIADPTTTYASVPLVQWVWPPAWPKGDNDDLEGEGKGHAGDEERGQPKKSDATSSATATAAASPILLLQRGRILYVLHQTGAAVQVCPSLLHCSPVQLLTRISANALRAEIYLQYGSYTGLLARNRYLRQLQLQYGPYAFYANATVSSQAPAVKVKWFKKFRKSANSADAARRRVQERPHQMAWLQHVYMPSAEDLAYQLIPSDSFASKSNSSETAQNGTPKISFRSECLVGSGVTHVGNVLDVNLTDQICLATLAVEALAVNDGVQQLVSSTGMLTDSLRQMLQHLTAVLERSERDAWMSVTQGNWAVAEVLAQLPLGCVVTVIGQEVRRAAAVVTAAMAVPSSARTRTNNNNTAYAGVSDVRKREQLADLQRWWWLLVRSSTLVTAVNTIQIDAASRVMTDVLEELPLSSPLLQPPASEEAVTNALSQAMLLCSPRFMPTVVPQMLQRDTKSVTKRLKAAVKAALVTLGAREATTASPSNAEEGEGIESNGFTEQKTEETAKGPCNGASAATSWSSLFSTVRMDGAHWTHAVYYTNLLTHLRNLAQAEEAKEENTKEEVEEKGVVAEHKEKAAKRNDAIRALAAECLAGADSTVEASAAAVLDVATQTVGVLLGAVVDVPAATRSHMVDAVAQSTSKRQQVLETNPNKTTVKNSAAMADGATAEAAVTRTDVPFVEEEMFSDRTPIDHLRRSLYEAQWRDLYGTFAYPTRYFFRSFATSSSSRTPLKKKDGSTAAPAATNQRGTGTLPYQLAYNTYARGACVQRPAAAAPAPSAVDAAPSATSRHDQRGRVQKVQLTEQENTCDGAAAAAAVLPTMEIELLPSSPRLNHEDGKDSGKPMASLLQEQQQQQIPLSLRATVANEEEDLHNTYFKGFAAQGDEKENNPTAAAAVAAPSSGGVSYESLKRSFAAQLQPVGRAVGEQQYQPQQAGSASAVQREQQRAADRQRVPDASAFAPSATPGDNAYGDHLYGALPSQQAFFARFQGEENWDL